MADCERRGLVSGQYRNPREFKAEGFANEVLRRGFVQKVYGILAAQLAITTVVAAPFAMKHQLAWQVQEQMPWLMGLSLAVFLAVNCVIMCAPQQLRQFPQNYLILLVFTLCEGLFVGLITAQYNIQAVALACGLTCAICCSLTMYALTTKTDFTGMGPYLFAGVIGLMLFGFVMMFVPHVPIVHKIYAGCGAILFSFFLVYDTQLIVGGKHERASSFSLDDYVLAALAIYMDIIQIFLYLLQLLGDRE
mmetsp:Transcript_11351/g.25225  ORF Transcript_11351/g.25225 Transcript_11351/m.25225 type:complete len:249 (+) Transcript_11351:52-798(+)